MTSDNSDVVEKQEKIVQTEDAKLTSNKQKTMLEDRFLSFDMCVNYTNIFELTKLRDIQR